VKEKLDFYVNHVAKIYLQYDGLKFMLGIRILIRFNPHLFDQIRILERGIAVCGLIFHPRSQIGIRVIENLSDLRRMILHLQLHYSTDLDIGTAYFYKEKEFANLSLGLIYSSLSL
jgi:hypothetical protein